VTSRLAPWIAGAVLLAAYVATLAPGVTFWDSGEFIAAARTVGIPHPPGTPLFVVLLAAWTHLVWFLSFAVACNLAAAVCTAGAAVLLGGWLIRAGATPVAAVAGVIVAGSASTLWGSATETEVYAASLLVVMAMIVAADRAGRTGQWKWLVLSAYLLALAIPVHLSVLVAAPVAILLAIDRPTGSRDWCAGGALFGVSIAVAGIGRLSPTLTIVGGLVVAGSAAIEWRRRAEPVRDLAWLIAAVVVGLSAALVLLVRARYDPAINQADPDTVHRLAYAIGRRQYDVAGLWPRRAPIWMQIANWFEYAGWQFGLSLGPTVVPSAPRIAIVAAFAALGLYGARDHRRMDRRTWRAMLLLFVCGSAGVLVYLNLKAGASFAWNLVRDPASHEARDRDYFFALSFWAWGAWAGLGAVAVARRLAHVEWWGLAAAALALALNWSAMNRRVEPEASLPHEVASTLLGEVPARGVLFVAGDNDTYPLWYLQQVEGVRRDVIVVTLPLLGAPWYARELRRRYGLLGQSVGGDPRSQEREIAAGARGAGRPVAAALTVSPEDRAPLGRGWRVVGVIAVEDSTIIGGPHRGAGWSVDTAAARRAAAGIANWRRGRTAHPALDPVNDYFLDVLSCPRWVVDPKPSTAVLASLDSLCNLR